MRKKRAQISEPANELPYANLHGFVIDLYEGILLRTPSVQDVEYWVNIASEMGTRHVLQQFTTSEELVTRINQSRSFSENWSLSQYGEVELLLKLICA